VGWRWGNSLVTAGGPSCVGVDVEVRPVGSTEPRSAPARGAWTASPAGGCSAGPADADLDRGRVVHERLTARSWQASGSDEIVVEADRFRLVERPRDMGRPGVADTRSSRAEQRPPGREEMIKLAQRLGRIPLADLDMRSRMGTSRTGPAPATVVADRSPGVLEPHLRPEVGQPVRRSGHKHCAQPGGIEGEEPDAGLPVATAHVRPHVRLGELRRPGNGPHAGKPDPEKERHQPDPGRPVARLNRKPGRKEGLHLCSRIPPVQERQLIPPLDHRSTGHRDRTHTETRTL
jgi:hypothetical protein